MTDQENNLPEPSGENESTEQGRGADGRFTARPAYVAVQSGTGAIISIERTKAEAGRVAVEDFDANYTIRQATSHETSLLERRERLADDMGKVVAPVAPRAADGSQAVVISSADAKRGDLYRMAKERARKMGVELRVSDDEPATMVERRPHVVPTATAKDMEAYKRAKAVAEAAAVPLVLSDDPDSVQTGGLTASKVQAPDNFLDVPVSETRDVGIYAQRKAEAREQGLTIRVVPG